MDSQLTTIRLNGELGKKFGRVHEYHVSTTVEAMRAMCMMIPEFKRHLRDSASNGVDYAVFVGKENISKEDLPSPTKGKTIKISPVIRGSKKAGMFQVIVGAILVVVGIIAAFIPGAQAASVPLMKLGGLMILGGVVQMLSPQAKINQSSNPNNGTSYNFNSPTTTTAQGNPVPLIYGRVLTGSAVVSAGIYAEDKQ